MANRNRRSVDSAPMLGYAFLLKSGSGTCRTVIVHERIRVSENRSSYLLKAGSLSVSEGFGCHIRNTRLKLVVCLVTHH